jgi:hypothetical protein
MKKFGMILSALAVLALVAAAVPARASITSHNWIAPLIKDHYDDFYGATVTGYQAGSTATLAVNVYNHFGSWQMNVSAVRIVFDWGRTNYTSDSSIFNATSPVEIPAGESRVLSVSFTLPDITVASNLVTHGYTIYVDDVNATHGLVDPASNWPSSGDHFVVYSSAQADAMTLTKGFDKYNWNTVFFTSQARQMLMDANGFRDQGDDAYESGDFTGATNYYKNATTAIENAYGNETKVVTAFENALLTLANNGGNMLNMIGIGYALFGIGFLFIGIGAMVWLVRKSGQPKAAQ